MSCECLTSTQLCQVILDTSGSAEIPSHLEQCEQCQSRLRELDLELGALRRVEADNPSQLEAPAQPVCRIGEYLILAWINQGGQADVYRAWHPRLKIDVVIKWFRQSEEPDADSTSILKLCSLRHSNLCQVYDIGMKAGRPYLVMEYVSGRNLDRWIETSNPSLLNVLSKLVLVARAIDSIHQQGALHLDLKPENILIDSQGMPRVIDIGMVRHQQGEMKCLSVPPGTPEYMAPEQFVGDVSRMGVGTDVFGLGAILYRILCGQTIRDENRVTLEPDWRLLKGAPRRLRKICEKALSLSQARRHKSAREFAEDLERFITMNHHQGRIWAVIAMALGFMFVLFGTSFRPRLWDRSTVSHNSTPVAISGTSEARRSAVPFAAPAANCRILMTRSITPSLIANSSALQTSQLSESLIQWSRQSRACRDMRIPYLILECPEGEWLRTGPSLSNPLAAISIPSVDSQVSVEITADSLNCILESRHQKLTSCNQLLLSLRSFQQQLAGQFSRFHAVLIIPPVN